MLGSGGVGGGWIHDCVCSPCVFGVQDYHALKSYDVTGTKFKASKLRKPFS